MFLPRYYRVRVQWPSGLRRSTQVRVSSEAWVRTPPEPFLFDSVLVEEHTSRSNIKFLDTIVDMGTTAAPRSTAIRGPRRALKVAVNWTFNA